MKTSPGDFLRLHLAHLDVLDVAQLLAGALILAAIAFGTMAWLRVRREDAPRPSMRPLRRWIGAATGLGMLSCVLGVVALAYHDCEGQATLGFYGHNTTLEDVFGPQLDANLGLAAGLVIGAIGLALGWTLEWLADGVEEPA